MPHFASFYAWLSSNAWLAPALLGIGAALYGYLGAKIQRVSASRYTNVGHFVHGMLAGTALVGIAFGAGALVSTWFGATGQWIVVDGVVTTMTLGLALTIGIFGQVIQSVPPNPPA